MMKKASLYKRLMKFLINLNNKIMITSLIILYFICNAYTGWRVSDSEHYESWMFIPIMLIGLPVRTFFLL